MARGRLLAVAVAAVALAGCVAGAGGPEAVKALAFDLESVAENLEFPASFAFTPDGTLVYAEHWTGHVRIVEDGTVRPDPLVTFPVLVKGESGLMSITLHPDFEDEPWLYAHYTVDGSWNPRGVIERVRVENGTVTAREVVTNDVPADEFHSGGIIEFGPDGMLYVTVGDAGLKQVVPDPWSLYGKVLRMMPTGERPKGNPFPFSLTWTSGHRNAFGLAWDARSGHLYATENGPTDTDEINLLRPGGFYGWPLARGAVERAGFTDPLRAYDVSIAPTEAEFYTGDRLGEEYRDDLYVGTWNTGALHRLVLDPDTGEIEREEVVLETGVGGVLDVEQGPDGHLYVSTATGIHRVVPRA